MHICRSFHPSPINWENLPELPARLTRHNVTLEKTSVRLNGFPDTIGVDSLEEAREKVRRGFNPHTYNLHITCKQDDKSVWISIFLQYTAPGGFSQAISLID